MSRGRKRGFVGCLATQRYSKLDKDSASMCGNVMIGRFTLDVDVKRAIDALGFMGREDQAKIRALETGQFFCHGPALSEAVRLVKVGPVQTTHPKAGQRTAAPAPPQATIKKVLGELADLPAEAEKKAKSEQELRQEIQTLRKELTEAKRDRPIADPAIAEELSTLRSRYNAAISKVKFIRELLGPIPERLSSGFAELDALYSENPPVEAPRLNRLSAAKPVSREPIRPTVGNQKKSTTTEQSNGDLSGPEHRILDAIAWMESVSNNEPEKTAVAFLAGYTYGGGGFNNPCGALRTKGLIDYVPRDKIRLTEEGRGKANYPQEDLNSEELQRRVLDRLPGPERKILEVILRAYPKAITNEECAANAGYTHGGGGYNNPRGRLRTLGLIEYQTGSLVKARDILFL